MSRRTSIVKALVEKFKTITGTSPYHVNLFGNAFPILKFWNEIDDFPAVYVTAGPEFREYLPGDFAWVHFNISIKAYCKGEDAQLDMETLLEDLETCINLNRELTYDVAKSYKTTEILVQSIVTDEGLLAPYAVGEITVTVQYQKMTM